MATTRRPRKQTKILLYPTIRETKSTQRELPKFEPHDLRSLIKEAKANDQEESKIGILLAFRRRNAEQLTKLLRRLGVDPSEPDAWRRGFLRLAVVHHRVGHLAWYRQRTNKNAATWTTTHDISLLLEVGALRQQGLSERAAIRKIVTDPKRRQMFPYRRKGHFAPVGEQRNREAALWVHWENLKASSRGKSLADAFGTNPDSMNFFEQLQHDIDLVNSLPAELVKNQGGSKSSRS